MNVAKEAAKARKKYRRIDQRTVTISRLMPHLKKSHQKSVARWMHSQGWVILRERRGEPYRVTFKERIYRKKIIKLLRKENRGFSTTMMGDRINLAGTPLMRIGEQLRNVPGIKVKTLRCLERPRTRKLRIFASEPNADEKIEEEYARLKKEHIEKKSRQSRGSRYVAEKVFGRSVDSFRARVRDHPRVAPKELDMYLKEGNTEYVAELKYWRSNRVHDLEVWKFVTKVQRMRGHGRKVVPVMASKTGFTREARKILKKFNIKAEIIK